jgi:hypothetical protein
LRRGLVAVTIIAIAGFHLWSSHFRGLATSQAMDQAQIGRAIASGHGWRTNVIRPRAVAQLQAHGKDIQKISLDTYHAPLPPLVDAIALWPVKSHWKMTPADVIYVGDKAIAAMSILLFLASVAVLFFIARRLFDRRLALLGCGLVLLCDAIWQYSLSGLPQMLLLLLFNPPSTRLFARSKQEIAVVLSASGLQRLARVSVCLLSLMQSRFGCLFPR